MPPAAGHGVAVAAATLLVCGTTLGSSLPDACEPREDLSLRSLTVQEDDISLLSLTTQVHVRARRRKHEVAADRPPRRQVRVEEEEAAKEPEPSRRAGHTAAVEPKEPPVEDGEGEQDTRVAEEFQEPQVAAEEQQPAAEESQAGEPQAAEQQEQQERRERQEPQERQEPRERQQRQLLPPQHPQHLQYPQHRKRHPLTALPSESTLFAASDSVIEVPVLLLFAGVVLLAAVGALLLFWIVEHVPSRKRTRPTEASPAKPALQDHPMDKSFLFHVLSSIESKKKAKAYTAEVLSKGPPPKVDDDSSDDCSTLPRPEKAEPESEADEGEVRQQHMAEADWALQIALCDARPPATLPRHLDVGALAVLRQVLAERQRRQER